MVKPRPRRVWVLFDKVEADMPTGVTRLKSEADMWESPDHVVEEYHIHTPGFPRMPKVPAKKGKKKP